MAEKKHQGRKPGTQNKLRLGGKCFTLEKTDGVFSFRAWDVTDEKAVIRDGKRVTQFGLTSGKQTKTVENGTGMLTTRASLLRAVAAAIY